MSAGLGARGWRELSLVVLLLGFAHAGGNETAARGRRLRVGDTCVDRSCARCAGFRRMRSPLTATDSAAAVGRTNVSVELVVTHCSHDLTWISQTRDELVSSGLHLKRATIYIKCGGLRRLAQMPALKGMQIVSLPNVGRCDHTWAFHLAHRYYSLADVIIFLKDSTFDYPLIELRALLHSTLGVVHAARLRGFGCFRRPDLSSSEWHVRREAFKFRLPGYVSADRLARLRKAHIEQYGLSDGFSSELTLCEFAARVLGDGEQLGQLLGRAYMPVCYGGSFAVTGERARTLSRFAFDRLERLLRRGDSIEEGHYAERLWAAFFQPPMPRHEEQLFANGAGRNYALSTGMLGTSYAGVVKRCCCERVPQDLDRRPTPFPTTAASAPHGAARRMHAFATALRARADEGALHVVLVSHSFDLDGAPVYLLQLAGWLLQQGHRVLCTAPTDGRLRAQLLALGAQTAVVQGLHVGRRSQWESLYAALQQLPPFSSPDFVVFNTVIWADLMFAHDKLRWCRRAPRIVWVIHELELDDAHKTMTGYWWGHDFATLRSAPLLRRTHLSADAVVFVSEAQRAIWQRYDHVHFHVIPGHAEHVLQPIRPPLALPSRSALGVSASAFLISVIGTFCVRKRQGLALDALENILAKGGDAHLLLVGAPSELGGMGGEAAYIMMLQKRATSPALQGRVTFVPFERSGWRYSAIADLHVSASTHEAYPLSTLEAMRQGVPVIATAAGGTAEQFPSDDVAWMVAPIRPSEHFIAAIERAHGLHQRGQLKRLGELQQRFSAGAAGRFSEGWAQLVERLLYASRVNDACQLWTAEDEESCVVGGRRAGVGPRR